jgi:hypothetical protein
MRSHASLSMRKSKAADSDEEPELIQVDLKPGAEIGNPFKSSNSTIETTSSEVIKRQPSSRDIRQMFYVGPPAKNKGSNQMAPAPNNPQAAITTPAIFSPPVTNPLLPPALPASTKLLDTANGRRIKLLVESGRMTWQELQRELSRYLCFSLTVEEAIRMHELVTTDVGPRATLEQAFLRRAGQRFVSSLFN